MATAPKQELGRLVIGPWREDTAQYREDKSCRMLREWAEHFEKIAAGRETLSPAAANTQAEYYRWRISERVAKLDRVAGGPRRPFGRTRRPTEHEQAELARKREDRARREKEGTSLSALLNAMPKADIPQARQVTGPLAYGADCVTAEEAAQKTAEELLALDGLGPHRLELVRRVLASVDLSLKGEGA